LACAPNNIRKDGFDIEFDTWSDTLVHGASCYWIAFEGSFATSPISPIRMLTNKQPFKKDNPDYQLYTGTGSRSIRRKIPFSPNFHTIPNVIISQYMIDVIAENDARLSADAESISNTNYFLNLSTWKDTKVWGCGCNWLAFEVGKLEDADTDEEKNNLEPSPKKQKTEESPTTTTTTTTSSNHTTSTTPTTITTSAESSKECKICMDKQIDTVLLKCGHLCVCHECANELTKKGSSNNKCPICQQKTTSVNKVFLS